MCPSPLGSGVEHTRLRERGLGGPNSDEGTESDRHCGTLGIYVYILWLGITLRFIDEKVPRPNAILSEDCENGSSQSTCSIFNNTLDAMAKPPVNPGSTVTLCKCACFFYFDFLPV